MRNIGLVFIGLILLLTVLVNLTPVQNFIAGKATAFLENKLKTKVRIGHIRIDFLNHITVQGLYIEDRQKDTLLYAGELQGRITDWFILHKETPVITYIGLHNTYAHLYRTAQSKTWNYQFIIDAFGTKGSSNNKKSAFEFDLKQVDLENVRFHMDDAWKGDDMDYEVGSLQADTRKVDFKKHIIAVNSISIDATTVMLRNYAAGEPAIAPGKQVNAPQLWDSTPFNPDKWVINVKKLSLQNSLFSLEQSEGNAEPGAFDANHLHINKIALNANNINITGDTIHGNIENLHAEERCGLVIKQMKSKVTVSPIASICENLYLETNNSIVKDYYAMRYRHFPDFTDYITNVVMEGHLKNSKIDDRDIAYFAPLLRQWPTVVMVSGNAKGSVANLSGQHLSVTDGKTLIKGDFKMAGLPDIYKTKIDFDNGAILTTGAGIMKYAPRLKSDSNIALNQLTYAYFKGDYSGLIENFAVKGILHTNLGSATVAVSMNLPGFKDQDATYAGTITANDLDIGTFFRQPVLGKITFNAKISGHAFNPDIAKLQVDANITRFDCMGYSYQQISAMGIMQRKQFTGELHADDPNLIMDFNGYINYIQKEININATASVPYSNLNALKLTTDSITAACDFDLNCAGSNIDNFLGYAKLYNLNIKRKQNRLNVDSIYLYSATTPDSQKTLTLQSNDITASISGHYSLTKLPASFQYYLSEYIPNYIKKPSKTAPEQDLTFNIVTRDIDSVMSLLIPSISGFDDGIISGSLNTTKESLTLDAKIPYGVVNNIHLYNLNVNGTGNFNSLDINTSADNVVVGDSLLSGSLSVTASLGNDSMQFTIATTTIDAVATVTLKGQVYAKSDSLYVSLLPSDFYLKQARWTVQPGNSIVYSKDYLNVKDLVFKSGMQEVAFNSEYAHDDQTLDIDVQHIDLGWAGAWSGLSQYQPDGRANGSIKAEHLFKDLTIAADLKANNVKLGNDTVGNIAVTGTYNKNKQIFSFDPATGIYRGDKSLTVSGNWSFNGSSPQPVDGTIQCNNAPLAWLSPILTGYLSRISGSLNGSVSLSGSSDKPTLTGKVAMQDAAFRIDFLGTYYKIPTETITVDNHKIDVGTVTVYDSFKNTASLTGYISHDFFKDMALHFSLTSSKFEVFHLQQNENPIFYGNLIASINPLTVRGPLNDITINVSKALPAERSHIYIPVSTSSDVSTYSFVSFKSYGSLPDAVHRESKNKLNIKIDAALRNLATLTLILDPSTGDAITARGTGNISLEIPASNEIRMFGAMDIEEGDYTFTFKQLFFKRKFILNAGSQIRFNGPLPQTQMDVNATYTTRARLYDLLNDAEKQNGVIPQSELTDSKIAQDVNVLLHMKGTLNDPKLTFNIDLPEKRSVGTYAYTKLMRLNDDENELFDQVASLLLVQTFIPPEGYVGTTARTGAINNVSDIISTTASSQLTNIVNKLFGNKNLAVDLKYENYNLSDPTLGALNRNQVTLGVRKNYFNDRLSVEVGGTSDWGHPSSTSAAASFNLAGDFRIQYLLRQGSGLRFNIFRTSDYDVTIDRDINRGGVGLSWRKTFDNFPEFIHGNKFANKKEIVFPPTDSNTKVNTNATNGNAE